MPVEERKYMVIDNDGKSVPVYARFRSKSLSAIYDCLVAITENVTPPEEKCSHIHCLVCQLECSKDAGHEGRHYYNFAKALRDKNL
jgi:hypothetical protein